MERGIAFYEIDVDILIIGNKAYKELIKIRLEFVCTFPSCRLMLFQVFFLDMVKEEADSFLAVKKAFDLFDGFSEIGRP